MMYWLGLIGVLLVAYLLIIMEEKFNDNER